MSSNDVGSYELKRLSCGMQMEERSANLARSTSDGSANKSNNKNTNHIIASRIPVPPPEGSPFAATGIISF